MLTRLHPIAKIKMDWLNDTGRPWCQWRVIGWPQLNYPLPFGFMLFDVRQKFVIIFLIDWKTVYTHLLLN